MSLSGFFLQFYHIWFLQYFPIISVFFVQYCVHVFFISLFCVLFVSFCASGIILLFGHSFVMCLVVCGSGCLLIWSRMASSGSVFVCLLNWLCRKLAAVYRWWSDVLSVVCNYSSCFGDLYFV